MTGRHPVRLDVSLSQVAETLFLRLTSTLLSFFFRLLNQPTEINCIISKIWKRWNGEERTEMASVASEARGSTLPEVTQPCSCSESGSLFWATAHPAVSSPGIGQSALQQLLSLVGCLLCSRQVTGMCWNRLVGLSGDVWRWKVFSEIV